MLEYLQKEDVTYLLQNVELVIKTSVIVATMSADTWSRLEGVTIDSSRELGRCRNWIRHRKQGF